MISFQLCWFWPDKMPLSVTCSEIEEDLTIGSINPSFTKNNKSAKSIVFRDDLPRNVLGKVQKEELKKRSVPNGLS
jgi:acyl-CoA synthetase (AMP-forming)/AMP-acid ligase II